MVVRVLFLYQNLRKQQFLTHCAVVSHETSESLLVGEVRHKMDAEGVSGGGDDPLGRYLLCIRLLLPTKQSRRLSVRLHLNINTTAQRNQSNGITRFRFEMFKVRVKSHVDSGPQVATELEAASSVRLTGQTGPITLPEVRVHQGSVQTKEKTQSSSSVYIRLLFI